MGESPPDIEALSLDDLKRLLLQLFEEIARLNGLKGRPKLKPSGMDKKAAARRRSKEGRKQARRGKKNARLVIDEERAVLRAGLEGAAWISVEGTGARHRARNGVSTQIGNADFAWFATTFSKSRRNFLALPRAGQEDCRVNDAANSTWGITPSAGSTPSGWCTGWTASPLGRPRPRSGSGRGSGGSTPTSGPTAGDRPGSGDVNSSGASIGSSRPAPASPLWTACWSPPPRRSPTSPVSSGNKPPRPDRPGFCPCYP